MASEQELRAKIAAAGRATAELGSFDHAFKTLRAAYFMAWQSSAPTEAEARERLWMACQIVGKIEDHLRQVAAGGQIAEADLARITKLAAE